MAEIERIELQVTDVTIDAIKVFNGEMTKEEYNKLHPKTSFKIDQMETTKIKEIHFEVKFIIQDLITKEYYNNGIYSESIKKATEFNSYEEAHEDLNEEREYSEGKYFQILKVYKARKYEYEI